MQKCILLVEDDPGDILLIQRAVRKAEIGIPLETVQDGQSAIEYLDGLGKFADRVRFPLPSHLVLDIKLPKKSGLEVLAWLRSHATLRRYPVVILTSSSEHTDVRAAYELGIDAFLVKPVGLDRLVSVGRAIGAWAHGGRIGTLDEHIPPPD